MFTVGSDERILQTRCRMFVGPKIVTDSTRMEAGTYCLFKSVESDGGDGGQQTVKVVKRRDSGEERGRKSDDAIADILSLCWMSSPNSRCSSHAYSPGQALSQGLNEDPRAILPTRNAMSPSAEHNSGSWPSSGTSSARNVLPCSRCNCSIALCLHLSELQGGNKVCRFHVSQA